MKFLAVATAKNDLSYEIRQKSLPLRPVTETHTDIIIMTFSLIIVTEKLDKTNESFKKALVYIF